MIETRGNIILIIQILRSRFNAAIKQLFPTLIVFNAYSNQYVITLLNYITSAIAQSFQCVY